MINKPAPQFGDFIAHTFPIEKTFDQNGYADVGRCIYCGNRNVELTKEHIIGRGLNGTITLFAATCAQCQGITRDIEQACFRGMMGGFRLKEGFRTSHPKNEPIKVTARQGDDPEIILELMRHELPGAIAVPKTPPPIEIFGPWPKPNSVTMWMFWSDMQWPKDTVFSTGPFHANTYGRMLAKIAHSYAAAEIGIDGFDAFLAKIILDPALNPFQFIGCIGQAEEDLPNEHCLHRISLECWEKGDRLYLIVKMRLLAYIGAPEYHVVVGTVTALPKAAMTRAFSSKMVPTQPRK